MGKKKEVVLPSTVVITQIVDNDAVTQFGDKFTELLNHAKAKGYKKPRKGDLLSQIIKKGVCQIKISTYFNK